MASIPTLNFDAIIIGGGGAKRTPALAAKFAAEFNIPFVDIDTLTNLKIGLGHALRQHALATSLVNGRIDVVDLGQRIFSTQAQQKNKKNTQNSLHEDPHPSRYRSGSLSATKIPQP